ncbi:hypothetical protein DL764_005422 [Monosporascus ibericus]|uniref:Uncharacterized protein n=1 Tax=Monosporascus ibericus TaxID=155417 RepID=A0A4Q4TCZ5_9PEZI|nr:hypothetical protein DL764_005422 [Monosporascus ibericus]
MAASAATSKVLSAERSRVFEKQVKLVLAPGETCVKRQDNLGRHIAKLHGDELLVAAAGEDEAIIRLVLDKGANIDSKDGKYGRTLLSLAAANGHEAVVKLLLDNGANTESKDGKYGRTLLSLAAANGCEAVVKLLLDKGANIESKDFLGRTPLSCATEKGHETIINLLRPEIK